jgi:hypothetical protein
MLMALLACTVLTAGLLSCAGAAVAGRRASDLQTTWYLAEGSTGQDATGNFDTFVLVANPGATEASIKLWHQLETPDPDTGGEWPGASFTLPAHSRATVNVAETLQNGTPPPVHLWSVSTRVTSNVPVAAERAVYWTSNSVRAVCGVVRQAASESVGVATPATTWYLAEGSTHNDGAGSMFETWVLVQNPNTSTAEVDLYYQTPTGEVHGPHLSMAGMTRRTVSIADTLPSEDSVSTRVVSSAPVIAERAMYWSNPTVRRVSAHDSVGITAPRNFWYMPYGTLAAQMQYYLHFTYVLVQNPQSTPAVVTLSFYGDSGAGAPVTGATITMPPHSRHTFDIFSEFNSRVSAFGVFTSVIDSDVPVIAEKAVYTQRTAVHTPWTVEKMSAFGAPGSNVTARNWYLAEGSTGSGTSGSFKTGIVVANPGPGSADVRLFYQTPDGEVAGPSFALGPYKVHWFEVGDTLPGVWSVSTRVQASAPVVAERAMTWTSASNGLDLTGTLWVGTEAGTSSLGIPSD